MSITYQVNLTTFNLTLVFPHGIVPSSEENRGKKGKATMAIEQTFTCGPNRASEVSAFIGEDIRSAKVYRHIDLPIPAVIFALKDGRYAKQQQRFGGMASTIVIYANRQELNSALDKTCIYDPESGKLRK